MKRKKILLVLFLWILATAFPATAMMEGMHGHRGMENRSRDQASESREKRETYHYHGNYRHTHEGGQLPHSHSPDRVTREGDVPQSEMQDAPSVKPESREEPSRQSAPEREPDSGKADRTPMSAPEGSGTRSPDAPAAGAAEPPAESGSMPAPGAVLQGRDDMVLHLVPSGTLPLPESVDPQGSQSMKVDAFYMDETHVTNHQYVEFLNEVLSGIRVENGVVRKDDGIWLLLGEAQEGYEPIVFENGAFRVNGAHHAACAVLRVTGYGAAAYARHHGKRLPDEAEWLYAVNQGRKNKRSVLPIPSPVVLYPPNTLGIRGLNSNIGHWGVRSSKLGTGEHAGKEHYVVLGGSADDSTESGSSSPAVVRYPWEAFANVGFRCVVNASDQTQ